jgi:hypothetical protein
MATYSARPATVAVMTRFFMIILLAILIAGPIAFGVAYFAAYRCGFMAFCWLWPFSP